LNRQHIGPKTNCSAVELLSTTQHLKNMEGLVGVKPTTSMTWTYVLMKSYSTPAKASAGELQVPPSWARSVFAIELVWGYQTVLCLDSYATNLPKILIAFSRFEKQKLLFL